MPLELYIEREDGDPANDLAVIVSDNVVLCYGAGEDRELALADYLISLGEWIHSTHRSARVNKMDSRLLARAFAWITGASQEIEEEEAWRA